MEPACQHGAWAQGPPAGAPPGETPGATDTQGVDIVVTSAAVPSTSAEPLILFGYVLPFNPVTVNAYFTACFNIVTIAMGLVGVIRTFSYFVFFLFVVYLYQIVLGVIMMISSLKPSMFVAKYVGLLQYPAGSGLMLVLSGALMVGNTGAGPALGGLTITWGFVSILIHLWLRKKNMAVNAHIMAR